MREALTAERRNLILELAENTLFDDSEESVEARSYLFGSRKISDSVAREFHIGYIPKRAIGTGLGGRLILPLHDHHGNLVCFTTRDWRPDVHNRGHWHESFEKKLYLYGMHQAMESIMSSRSVVLVEGQFDVLRLHSIGVTNTVGLLGKKPSWFQLALLLREADHLKLALDNDEAGRLGAKEVFNILKSSGMSKMSNVDISFVQLKPAKDADELIDKLGCESAKERFI